MILTLLPSPVYHIHDQPVPSNGNCTATLAHLDPYIRGEVPPCDRTRLQTCQVGDLSGKYGTIPGTGTYQTSYLDLFTSTQQGPASFFGNRSVVIHTANTTRLTCANFQLVSSGSNATTSSTGGGAGGSPTGTSPPITSYTGAAAQRFISGAAVVAGLLAFAL